MVKGIPTSPGIAIGRVYRFRAAEPLVGAGPAAEDVPVELGRFEAAVSASQAELQKLRSAAAERIGAAEAEIFAAHLLILADPVMVDEATDRIRAGVSAAAAVQETIAGLAAMLRSLTDEYMRERASDVEDVGRRLLRHISGERVDAFAGLDQPRIIVAADLSPSDTAQMDRHRVLGLATEKGGRTSHTAIMARTLGIPAVVGATGLLAAAAEGDLCILDGEQGLLFVNPEPALLSQYEQRARVWAQDQVRLNHLKDLPAVTLDGHRIELAANAASHRDVESALAEGAEGIGLFRTEFLFMDRPELPDESEQYETYRTTLAGMGGRPVIIRTLDVGGDKPVPGLRFDREENPFLGWRGLRMCLDQPDFFKVQLRALWRAAGHGQLLVMFPMVTALEEVRQAKHLLAEARAELVAAQVIVPAALSVGVMIEVPGAALIAEQLAPEVDFFSIGSNDLIQYTLAVDRVNERVSRLYQPLHPAVLRLIAHVTEAAHRHGKWVGMCGEMAGDLDCLPVLLGLGLDELSMSARLIPQVKDQVRNLSVETCRQIAAKALAAGTAGEVAEMLAEQVRPPCN